MLGTGRSLSPAAAVSPHRGSNLVSPSDSTVSLNSSISMSQQSAEPQDISSRVSIDHGMENNAAVAAASSRLVCPICNEEMVRSNNLYERSVLTASR